jgi:hypothetical protein
MSALFWIIGRTSSFVKKSFIDVLLMGYRGFFEDCKLYEGWGREAKQLHEEGSSRGLILSLLFDHCHLLHPEQTARIENKLPAYTVGSLQRKSQMDVLLDKSKPVIRAPQLSG